MLRIITNVRNLLFLVGILLPVGGYAAEITAIDFNGDIIGQVISTGIVISPDGENIGSVTADSLIVNEKGNVIGGVVPQGIVIGMDNRLLGKCTATEWYAVYPVRLWANLCRTDWSSMMLRK